jgi:hypothetical protein
MTAKGFQFDATGPWISKDPNAVLDYALDWADPLNSWLGDQTIASVTWTVAPGLTLVSQSNTPTVAQVRLSGGTVGTTYSVACRITTNTGEIDKRTFRVRVQER